MDRLTSVEEPLIEATSRIYAQPEAKTLTKDEVRWRLQVATVTASGGTGPTNTRNA